MPRGKGNRHRAERAAAAAAETSWWSWGVSPAAVIGPPFPFLSLPSELRNKIYEYVSDPDYVGEQGKLLLSVGVLDGKIIPHALARACRQTRDEFLPMFEHKALEYATHITTPLYQGFDVEAIRKDIEAVEFQEKVDESSELRRLRVSMILPDPSNLQSDLAVWFDRLRHESVFAWFDVTFFFECTWDRRGLEKMIDIVENDDRDIDNLWPEFSMSAAGYTLDALRDAVRRRKEDIARKTKIRPRKTWHKGRNHQRLIEPKQDTNLHNLQITTYWQHDQLEAEPSRDSTRFWLKYFRLL